MSPLSRRPFLGTGIAAGAGLVIGFYLPHGNSNGSKNFAPNAYLQITPDGKITVVVARSEGVKFDQDAPTLVEAES